MAEWVDRLSRIENEIKNLKLTILNFNVVLDVTVTRLEQLEEALLISSDEETITMGNQDNTYADQCTLNNAIPSVDWSKKETSL